MASDESMTPHSSVYSSMHDLDVDGYLAHDYADDDGHTRRHDMMYEDDDDDDGEEEEGGIEQEGDVDAHMDIQMSRLSLETWEGGDGDANTHLSDNVVDDKGGATSCDEYDGGVTWRSAGHRSLPGTPSRPCPTRRRAGSTKDYASESEASRCRGGARARRKRCGGAASERSSSSYSYYYRRSGRTAERQQDRAWEMKRCHWAGWDGGAPDIHSGGSSPCVVVRTTGPGAGCMWMDMEEVKACRDLGLELPCDWTVEIPPSALTAVAAAEAGGGVDSPTGNCRISSPGSDDPGDMKARLRVWAQAVALASASRLSS